MSNNYSVTIKGYTEKTEAENSISVIELKFSIVIDNEDNALCAAEVARTKLCEHIGIERAWFNITHIDIIPADER